MTPSTLYGINQLPEAQMRQIYTRLIPPELIEHFHLNPELVDEQGNNLVKLNCQPGCAVAEMSVFHQVGFRDPILYGHLTDTLAGQIHILLYVLNDVLSPRYDIDFLEDGTETQYGTSYRNIPAEQEAFQAGLAPGQVRRGLRMLGEAIRAFESFVDSLGHNLYFAEPLFYHNAVFFERYGFNYLKGRKLMERIQTGFSEEGDLFRLADGVSIFRQPDSDCSIRLRSWAIHDGIMGEPFTDVTMYKEIGKTAGINTCPNCVW
jgi:hypothetical protein